MMFDLPSHVSWNANRVPFYSFWVFASDDEALNHPISPSLFISQLQARVFILFGIGEGIRESQVTLESEHPRS